jgi:hypothetical protein
MGWNTIARGDADLLRQIGEAAALGSNGTSAAVEVALQGLGIVALMCISYDLIRRSVLAVRAVVSVDDGHAAMSFSFAKGSASIRV